MCPRRRSSTAGDPAGAGTGEGSAGAGRLAGLAGTVEDLYQLEPSEFTGARSALAAGARRGGDRDLAQQIAKLPRPSRSAFALNVLVHRRPGDVERLLQLAESLRDASKRLAGSELRELGAIRQHLIAELTSAARELASESGTPLSEASVDEIEESLQAALLDEEAARAVTSGHLARSLRVAGIGTAELNDALPSLPTDQPQSRVRERPVKKGAQGESANKHGKSSTDTAADVASTKQGPVDKEPEEKQPAARPTSRAGPAVTQHRDGGPSGRGPGRKPPGEGSARAQRRQAAEAARADVQEADETARRAATVAGAARKEVEKARRAHERALARRESAETALVSARRDELASSRALTAAEGASRRAEAALQAAERTRRDARHAAAG